MDGRCSLAIITPRYSSLSQFDQFVANRKSHKPETCEFHLAHDVQSMTLDGSHRHSQRSRSLLVALAIGQKPDDFLLSGSEHLSGIRRLPFCFCETLHILVW